jgi:hypothetical protein
MNVTALPEQLSRLARNVAVAVVIGTSSVAGFSAAAMGLAGPASATSVTAYGDPETSADNWQIQTLDDSCVLMSIASVVGDLTGELPSEREMVRLAGRIPSVVHEGPIYTRTDDVSGTMMPDALTLLDHYGITAGITDQEREFESGIETGMGTLKWYLGSGSGIIVSLNSNIVWDTEGDREWANHAVAVTGVDSKRGIVHINDSAYDGGANKEVPFEVFEKAWRTSDYRMIVTE